MLLAAAQNKSCCKTNTHLQCIILWCSVYYLIKPPLALGLRVLLAEQLFKILSNIMPNYFCFENYTRETLETFCCCFLKTPW